MIHIFTDYGRNGPYAGQLRGVLACEAPGVPAVDLMHDAPTRNPCRSAYLLAALATEMAPGDVCIAVVDPGVGGDRPAVGAGAKLEEILPMLADHESGLSVTGEGGEVIGVVSPKSVIAALAAAT